MANPNRPFGLVVTFETEADLIKFCKGFMAPGTAVFPADALDPEVARSASRQYVLRPVDEHRITDPVAAN